MATNQYCLFQRSIKITAKIIRTYESGKGGHAFDSRLFNPFLLFCLCFCFLKRALKSTKKEQRSLCQKQTIKNLRQLYMLQHKKKFLT